MKLACRTCGKKERIRLRLWFWYWPNQPVFHWECLLNENDQKKLDGLT